MRFHLAGTLPELLRAARLELKRANKNAQVPFPKAMECSAPRCATVHGFLYGQSHFARVRPVAAVADYDL
ncbi:hypothetical protein [Bradyrhizobium acaciae]|uniref:hypothetical protein n=1 Tax=Bradyrhizobium acaciae TaxID=2683706 RepID=UPI001E2E64DE|nr:hypothetical protein [Bradyrhizobium acaciae]